MFREIQGDVVPNDAGGFHEVNADVVPGTPETDYLGSLKTGFKSGVSQFLDLPVRIGQALGDTGDEGLVHVARDWWRPDEGDHVPTTIGEKVAAGVGSLPGQLATFAPATAALGPIGGFAAVESLDKSINDKGDFDPVAALRGAAEGALMGAGLKYIGGLPLLKRVPLGAGLFGGMTALDEAQGGAPVNSQDVIASAILGGAMSLPGTRSKYFGRIGLDKADTPDVIAAGLDEASAAAFRDAMQVAGTKIEARWPEPPKGEVKAGWPVPEMSRPKVNVEAAPVEPLPAEVSRLRRPVGETIPARPAEAPTLRPEAQAAMDKLAAGRRAEAEATKSEPQVVSFEVGRTGDPKGTNGTFYGSDVMSNRRTLVFGPKDKLLRLSDNGTQGDWSGAELADAVDAKRIQLDSDLQVLHTEILKSLDNKPTRLLGDETWTTDALGAVQAKRAGYSGVVITGPTGKYIVVDLRDHTLEELTKSLLSRFEEKPNKLAPIVRRAQEPPVSTLRRPPKKATPLVPPEESGAVFPTEAGAGIEAGKEADLGAGLRPVEPVAGLKADAGALASDSPVLNVAGAPKVGSRLRDLKTRQLGSINDEILKLIGERANVPASMRPAFTAMIEELQAQKLKLQAFLGDQTGGIGRSDRYNKVNDTIAYLKDQLEKATTPEQIVSLNKAIEVLSRQLEQLDVPSYIAEQKDALNGVRDKNVYDFVKATHDINAETKAQVDVVNGEVTLKGMTHMLEDYVHRGGVFATNQLTLPWWRAKSYKLLNLVIHKAIQNVEDGQLYKTLLLRTGKDFFETKLNKAEEKLLYRFIEDADRGKFDPAPKKAPPNPLAVTDIMNDEQLGNAGLVTPGLRQAWRSMVASTQAVVTGFRSLLHYTALHEYADQPWFPELKKAYLEFVDLGKRTTFGLEADPELRAAYDSLVNTRVTLSFANKKLAPLTISVESRDPDIIRNAKATLISRALSTYGRDAVEKATWRKVPAEADRIESRIKRLRDWRYFPRVWERTPYRLPIGRMEDGKYVSLGDQPLKHNTPEAIAVAKAKARRQIERDGLDSSDIIFGNVKENLSQYESPFVISGRNFSTILTAALDKVEKGEGVPRDILAKVRRETLAAIDAQLARGFQSHMLRRSRTTKYGYQGAEDNLRKVYFGYLSEASGYISRTKSLMDISNIMRGAKTPTAAELVYTQRYVRDLFAPTTQLDRVSSVARQFAFTWYLTANLRSALVNSTQSFVTGIPELSKYTKGTGAIAEQWYGRAFKKLVMNDLTTEERKMLEILHDRGTTADQHVQFISDLVAGDMLGPVRSGIRTLSTPFSAVETFNRKSAALASFMVFRKKGMTFDEALERSKEFVYDTQYLMAGKVNLPELARSGGKLGAVVRTDYTFRSFTHNYILWAAKTLRNPAERWAFARSLGYAWAFGGFLGVPAVSSMLDLAEKKLGFPIRRWVYQTLGGPFKPGDRDIVKRLTSRGFIGAAGFDVSGNLAIGVPLIGSSNVMDDIAGVWGGMGRDLGNAMTNIGRRNYLKAVEQGSPKAVSNLLKAIEGVTSGVTTGQGKPLLDENMRPVKLTPGEAVGQAIGFAPARTNMLHEEESSLINLTQHYSERKADAYARFFSTLRSGGDMSPVMDEIMNINRDIIDNDIPVSPITMDSLRGTVKQGLTDQPAHIRYKRSLE